MKKAKLIFSGIQPTGSLHIGNYLGAIKNWVKLQENLPEGSRLLYCIVDNHALTDKYKIENDVDFTTNLRDETLTMAAVLLASGINPKKSTLFVQSHVKEHLELNWTLSCIAPMNWLNKMTQFKEKKTKVSSLGLFSYPVLMAADILLYKATDVPVGEDQTQHLELARDYAIRFNQLFCKAKDPFFPLPKYLHSDFPRVMSLKDAQKKMSKSDLSNASRINLQDEPEEIYQKIMNAKTDSIARIKFDLNRPEVSNLIRIYSSFSGMDIASVEAKFQNNNMKEFKEALAEVIAKEIVPIALKAEEILEDKNKLEKTLIEFSEEARTIAAENMKQIRRLIGML